MMHGGPRGTCQIAVTCGSLLATSLTVLLRLVVRISILRTFGIEDGLVCAAFALSVALMALLVTEVHHGQGLHSEQVPNNELLGLGYTIYNSIPVYLTALVLTKLSILFLYLRFFQDKIARQVTIGTIIFVSIHGTILSLP